MEPREPRKAFSEIVHNIVPLLFTKQASLLLAREF